LVETFKRAWHTADERGEIGSRTSAGIDAVLRALAEHDDTQVREQIVEAVVCTPSAMGETRPVIDAVMTVVARIVAARDDAVEVIERLQVKIRELDRAVVEWHDRAGRVKAACDAAVERAEVVRERMALFAESDAAIDNPPDDNEQTLTAARTETEQFDQVWSALCQLVALKDGPRDAEYHRRKPLAWQRAREVLTSSGRQGGRITTTGLSAHPLRSAAGYPHVQGRCPACGLGSLFLASGGYLTCASLRCTDPTRASNLLHADAPVQSVASGSVEHSLERKPPDGGGGHTPGVGWMCTGCEWRFSYDVPESRARTVWLADARHAQNAETGRGSDE
jgi:hypothetical protein